MTKLLILSALLVVLVIALRHLLKRRPHLPNRVVGGVITQVGDPMSSPVLVPIQPGQKPRFKVTPAFSGDPFTLIFAQAAISTSDAANAPAQIVPDDPAGTNPDGTIFEVDLTSGVTLPAGGEGIDVDWSYANTDGVVAHVTGTLTENGIVDDVTGGTFEQVL